MFCPSSVRRDLTSGPQVGEQEQTNLTEMSIRPLLLTHSCTSSYSARGEPSKEEVSDCYRGSEVVRMTSPNKNEELLFGPTSPSTRH